jgi:hypothetical protein
MAVANGFGKVVTSGSVFMYDTGDTVNSYIGEPTVNLINPNIVNIYSWWTRNIASIVQLSETYKGQPIYRVSISIDNGDMLYHITERWGAGSGWYMPYVTFNANTPYIASVIYRPVSHPDTRIYGHPSNISGWGATVDGNIDIDTQWKMHRIDRNFGATVGDNRFYHMHTPSAQIGQTIVVDITNSQIEQKSHVTPFVNGTRSATQGLLPIVGDSSIDLSNVSFGSNAQIIFDGTDDTLAVNDVFSHKPNLPFSYEIIVYPLGSDSGTDKMLLGKPGWHTGIMYQSGYTWFRTRYGNPAFYDAGSYLLSPGNYYHLTAVYVPGTSMKFYVNGVLNGENTSVSSPLTDIGNTLNIGGSSTNYSCYVKIPVVKVYNRALSTAEVTQNYNKYKTRFNLS